jgi:type III restriction enzyme
VKTPVLVGRTDDRTDVETKLNDGVTLLRLKEAAIQKYAADRGLKAVRPVMLVVAQTIAEADEFGEVLTSTEFHGGEFADAVLVVHSDAPDEVLDKLATVEAPDSNVRIIISVGMLNVGWDVKSVYVIASMRASVSEILTEQTLGRGLRLPFGEYTGIEILDTLEVLAHERYEDLLKRTGVLNESFIDRKTRAVLRRNAQGDLVAISQTIEIPSKLSDLLAKPEPDEGGDHAGAGDAAGGSPDESGVAGVISIEARAATATETVERLRQTWLPREGMAQIDIPRLVMRQVESSFSLADITDFEPFRRLGEALAANPDDELRRTTISAKLVVGPDGLRRTELITATAVDRVQSQGALLPLDEARTRLADIVLASPVVPGRKKERQAIEPLLDAFVGGLGAKADALLSAYFDRAAARLVREVTEQHRRYTAKPSYDEVVEIVALDAGRTTARAPSADRKGRFTKNEPYEGWTRSVYPVEWFDSSTERHIANIADDSEQVICWTRLHRDDLAILWNSEGRQYNADFVVVEQDGTHWVVEAKMDKEMTSAEVQAKREAAKRWVSHVNASGKFEHKWRYLLASETDVADAKGSWEALKGLGS